MSTELLRRVLLSLGASSFTKDTRLRLLRDFYYLLQELNNPRNVDILLKVFLKSHIWNDLTVHELIQSNRYISSPQAHAAARRLRIEDYRSVLLLAGLVNAEQRDAIWFDYSPTLQRAMSKTVRDVTCDLNRKADLLVAVSYVRFSSGFDHVVIESLLEGLYLSDMVYSGDVLSNRGFKELGFLTRTVTDAIDASCLGEAHGALQVLLRQTTQKYEEQVMFATFLSILACTESLLRKVMYKPRAEYAHTSLKILQGLQHVHPDNAVFESWRFIFNVSLDMLGDELSLYVDSLLVHSVLSKNPLLAKGHFSAKGDREDTYWLLLVIEAARTIKSIDVLERIYNYCDHIVRKPPSSKSRIPSQRDLVELAHSVLLSLFAEHFSQFNDRIATYLRLILSPLSVGLSDRQYILIITTAYKLSLRNVDAEDPYNLLSSLEITVKNTTHSQTRTRMILAYIECLPLVPLRELQSQLQTVDKLIKIDKQQTDPREADPPLRARLVEVCTTLMSPDRALVCMDWLLMHARNDPYELAKL